MRSVNGTSHKLKWVVVVVCWPRVKSCCRQPAGFSWLPRKMKNTLKSEWPLNANNFIRILAACVHAYTTCLYIFMIRLCACANERHLGPHLTHVARKPKTAQNRRDKCTGSAAKCEVYILWALDYSINWALITLDMLCPNPISHPPSPSRPFKALAFASTFASAALSAI